MKTLFCVSGLVIASLCLGPQARAGTFEGPLNDTTICDSAIADTLAAPNTFVTSNGHCDSLCKKAASDCKKFVRRNIACLTQIYLTNFAYNTKSCAEIENHADSAGCKAGVKETAAILKQNLRGARDAELLECEGWGVDCQSACIGP